MKLSIWNARVLGSRRVVNDTLYYSGLFLLLRFRAWKGTPRRIELD
jgi:hypothetical protein